MTLGTFACILSMRRGEGMVEQISDLSGLARTNPALAFFLAMLLFSLAGIPPLAGFFAKFYVFLAAIKAGLYALAVIGVLASVVGAYYYLLIVKIMYFDEPAKAFEPMPGELKAVLGVAGLFNLLYFVYPAPLIDAAGHRGEIAVLMQLDPCGESAARRRGSSPTTRSARPTPRRCALARDGERGPLWIAAQTPDRRARPARPDLGVGAGQSLREPAADRSGAAGAVSPNCRSSRRSRCTTPSRGRMPGLASRLRAEMAERPPDRPHKFAGILIEGEGAAPSRSASASTACTIRTAPIIPATDLATRGRPHLAGQPVRAAVGRDGCAAGAMEPRRGLCRDPRRLARARRPASASRSASNPATASLPASFETHRRNRPLGSARRRWDNADRWRRATCFWRRGRWRWPVRRASSCSRRSAASARSA